MACIRRHRIVERFLSDMLGYAWNEADRLAGSIEHDLPQEVEDRLFVALHRPATCPHGFPIPEPEVGRHPRDAAAVQPRARATSRSSPSPARPTPTSSPSSTPSACGRACAIEVREKHPFDGPLVLRVDGQDRTVSQRVAQQIFVRKDSPDRRTTDRREQSA